MPPISVRKDYQLGAVPETYLAGWLRAQLSDISRAIWAPISRTVLAAMTVKASDVILLVDCTAGAVTVTFPPAAQMQFAHITVKKIDVSVNAVTLAATIDGAANPTLAAQYNAKTVFSDGVAWYTLATV